MPEQPSSHATRPTSAATRFDPIDSPDVDSGAGWLVVGAAFLAMFTVFGVAYSFGSFFGPMADEFGSQRGAIALIFSITTFLYFGLGVVTGRIADRMGPRPVLAVGSVCMVAGLLATAEVQSLWVGYVTYGLGVGIGVACAYVPMVAVVGLWFERRRTAALGVAVAGIGVGTLVVAPIAEALIDRYGWRDTYRLMAVAAAVLLVITMLGARRPGGVVDSAPVLPLRQVIAGSRVFAIMYVASVSMVLALFLPFVFLADYVDDRQIDGPAGLLVGAIGFTSVLGRLGFGALAARLSAIRLYQGSFLVIGLSFLIWFAAGSSYPALLVYAVVLGVAYGGFIALSPAVAAELFGPIGLGGVLGALYTAAGVGGLIGPPAAGAMIDRFGYRPMLLIACAFAVLGFVILLGLRDEGAAATDAVPATAGDQAG